MKAVAVTFAALLVTAAGGEMTNAPNKAREG